MPTTCFWGVETRNCYWNEIWSGKRNKWFLFKWNIWKENLYRSFVILMPIRITFLCLISLGRAVWAHVNHFRKKRLPYSRMHTNTNTHTHICTRTHTYANINHTHTHVHHIDICLLYSNATRELCVDQNMSICVYIFTHIFMYIVCNHIVHTFMNSFLGCMYIVNQNLMVCMHIVGTYICSHACILTFGKTKQDQCHLLESAVFPSKKLWIPWTEPSIPKCSDLSVRNNRARLVTIVEPLVFSLPGNTKK